MIRSFLAATAILFASSAHAETWMKLDDAGIKAALNDRFVQYVGGNVKQEFTAGGDTIYIDGSPSFGGWRVQGDQYCSTWPPAGGWDCYDFHRLGEVGSEAERVRFTDKAGVEWVARYIDR